MAVINQIYQLINTANKQAFGENALQVIDESSLIAMGNYVLNSSNSASLDVWTGSLVDQIAKVIFVNRPLEVDNLGLSRDESEWGAVTVKYRVKPIDVEHNTEYDLDSESEFNPFEIKTPVVDRKMFNKKGTFKATVTVTDKQIASAFTGEAQLQAFYSLIYKQLDDAMTRSENSWDHLGLCNFIGEKIYLQTQQPTKKHAINVVEAYYNESGKRISNLEHAYLDEDFLKFNVNKIIEMKKNMAVESEAFNNLSGFPSQTPADRLMVFVNTKFASKLPAYLYSDTFHKEMVTLDGYHEVQYWQGIKGTNYFDYGRTGINIKLASNSSVTVEQDNIIAVLCDRDALGTFYNRLDAESWRVPTKGVNTVKKISRELFCDLAENGVVLYWEPIDDARIAEIELLGNNVVLTPSTFSPDTYEYTGLDNTSSGTSDFRLIFKPMDREATITATEDDTELEIVSMLDNYYIEGALSDGVSSEFVITVTSGDTTKSYTFTVTWNQPEE